MVSMTGELGERLVGWALPALRLPSTDGGAVGLAGLEGSMVDMPGVTIPEGWRETPGLSGCTAEACGFREAHGEMADLGARIVSVSVQDTAYQREFVRRFHPPFAPLSDAALRLARALELPTVTFGGETLLRRPTLIADPRGVARKVDDVIPNPGRHALEVARCLEGARRSWT